MSRRLDSVVNVLLGVSAIVVVFHVIRGDVAGRASAATTAERVSPADWQYAAQKDPVLGSRESKVKLVVVTDFECPFCRDLHERIVQRMRGADNSVSLSVIHYPLPTHRFASQAALAYECTSGRGRARMMDELYSAQDSLGVLSWSEIAHRADVDDSSAFSQCMSEKSPVVEADVRFGERISVRATPTVLVNGFRLAGPPSNSQLDSIFALASTAGKEKSQ